MIIGMLGGHSAVEAALNASWPASPARRRWSQRAAHAVVARAPWRRCRRPPAPRSRHRRAVRGREDGDPDPGRSPPATSPNTAFPAGRELPGFPDSLHHGQPGRIRLLLGAGSPTRRSTMAPAPLGAGGLQRSCPPAVDRGAADWHGGRAALPTPPTGEPRSPGSGLPMQMMMSRAADGREDALAACWHGLGRAAGPVAAAEQALQQVTSLAGQFGLESLMWARMRRRCPGAGMVTKLCRGRGWSRRA